MDNAQIPPAEQVNSISSEQPALPEQPSVSDNKAAAGTPAVTSIANITTPPTGAPQKIVDLSKTAAKTSPVNPNATATTKKADEEENELITEIEKAHESA